MDLEESLHTITLGALKLPQKLSLKLREFPRDNPCHSIMVFGDLRGDRIGHVGYRQ